MSSNRNWKGKMQVLNINMQMLQLQYIVFIYQNNYGSTVGFFFFTCEETFAGVSCRKGLDAVWGVRNLISSIFNGDSIWACRVRHIRHSVGAVPVVLDGCILWLALWVLSIDNIELF